MSHSEIKKTWNELLNLEEPLILPVAHDALSARLIEQAGFKVEMINYSKKISQDLVIKYGLMKDDLIPIGKKLPSN